MPPPDWPPGRTLKEVRAQARPLVSTAFLRATDYDDLGAQLTEHLRRGEGNIRRLSLTLTLAGPALYLEIREPLKRRDERIGDSG